MGVVGPSRLIEAPASPPSLSLSLPRSFSLPPLANELQARVAWTALRWLHRRPRAQSNTHDWDAKGRAKTRLLREYLLLTRALFVG